MVYTNLHHHPSGHLPPSLLAAAVDQRRCKQTQQAQRADTAADDLNKES
jgi:hypothetical protein